MILALNLQPFLKSKQDTETQLLLTFREAIMNELGLFSDEYLTKESNKLIGDKYFAFRCWVRLVLRYFPKIGANYSPEAKRIVFQHFSGKHRTFHARIFEELITNDFTDQSETIYQRIADRVWEIKSGQRMAKWKNVSGESFNKLKSA